MSKGGIIWESSHPRGNSMLAMRNGYCVGFIVKNVSGHWYYKLDKVHCKWITKGYGEVSSKAQAKRSLVRAWTAWLDAFQLEPRKEATND